MRTTSTISRSTSGRTTEGTGRATGGTVADLRDPRALLYAGEPDPSWVDAGPFRAHLRHLMSVGRLDAAEVAVVLGLPTRAVQHLLEGRAGRVTRRISPHTARRLLVVGPADVRGLRWALTPTGAARVALHRLRADGWSDVALATAAGAGIDELAALETSERCSRLVSVRLVGLARRMPATVDDQDLAPLGTAA